MYLQDDSRELCANPFFAIGYAKGSLEVAIRALLYDECENEDFVLENVRTALEALKAVNYGQVSYVPPF